MDRMRIVSCTQKDTKNEICKLVYIKLAAENKKNPQKTE